MAKIGYLRSGWLWLGAFAASMSVLVIVTGRDENRWIGAALVAVAVLVGGVLARRVQAAQPVPKPTGIAWDNPATYVGVAIWIAGLVIGLTVSERWTTRGDYTLVAVIASVWIPTVIVVMRRFPSGAGRAPAGVGAWIAALIPLSRALPESVLGVSSSIVVGLTAGFLSMLGRWALDVDRTRRDDANPPVVHV